MAIGRLSLRFPGPDTTPTPVARGKNHTLSTSPFRNFMYCCIRKTSDMLCAFLGRPGSLSSLIVKNAGLGDLAGAAIMAAIGKNTILKTLDLSGNDIGGTSDLLATHHYEQGADISSLSATTSTTYYTVVSGFGIRVSYHSLPFTGARPISRTLWSLRHS